AKELKLHRPRRIGFLDLLLEPTCARLRDDLNTGMTIYAAAASWGQLLFFIAIALIVFALPGWAALDTVTLAGAVMTTLYATSPLEAVMTWLPALGQASVSLRKVDELNPLGQEPSAAALDDQAARSLRQLRLEQKVSVRDGAFSTTELSQGQRKRLALLTAYLEDRPVYLFDEWAADQDPMFKKVFYTQPVPELKAR